MEAVAEVKHVVTALKEVRENISVHHKEWFATVEQICDSVGVEPSLPRLCARQKNRSNIPAENACEYYRRVISIPLLDHLISELESRFDKHKQTALQGMYLVSALLVTKSIEEILLKVGELGKMYVDNLCSISGLESELHCWHLKWKQQEQEHIIKTLADSLYIASYLLLSREKFQWTKTPLRSTMVNERLSYLALLHLHRHYHYS